MAEKRQLAQVWSRAPGRVVGCKAKRVVACVLCCTGLQKPADTFCTNINSQAWTVITCYCLIVLLAFLHLLILPFYFKVKTCKYSTVPPDAASVSSSHFTLEAIIVLLDFISFITSVTGYFAD